MVEEVVLDLVHVLLLLAHCQKLLHHVTAQNNVTLLFPAEARSGLFRLPNASVQNMWDGRIVWIVQIQNTWMLIGQEARDPQLSRLRLLAEPNAGQLVFYNRNVHTETSG